MILPTAHRGIRRVLAGLILALGAFAGPSAQAADAEGSREVLLSRLQGYEICDFSESDFDQITYPSGTGDNVTDVSVEGHTVRMSYCAIGNPSRSTLQIYRNYEAALKAMGGTIAYGNGQYELVATVKKDGRETWVHFTGNESEYRFEITEKGGLLLEAGTADDMLAQLNANGHVALQVNFDTAKATLRPDAKPTMDQIVALLKANPTLKLRIEGHTDNVGAAAANKTLSEARAKSVVDALVAAGIAATRLTRAGFGQERPIASNSEDAGRAKNRRVELVKL